MNMFSDTAINNVRKHVPEVRVRSGSQDIDGLAIMDRAVGLCKLYGPDMVENVVQNDDNLVALSADQRALDRFDALLCPRTQPSLPRPSRPEPAAPSRPEPAAPSRPPSGRARTPGKLSALPRGWGRGVHSPSRDSNPPPPVCTTVYPANPFPPFIPERLPPFRVNPSQLPLSISEKYCRYISFTSVAGSTGARGEGAFSLEVSISTAGKRPHALEV